jgi:hypothetical protein
MIALRAAACADADERWQVVDDGRVLADASLWATRPLRYAGLRAGIIGRYSAAERDAAAVLLAHAVERLRLAGCRYAIGPMDGDTWHGYRLVTDAGSEPPFFLEPANPVGYVDDFRRGGFATIEGYHSTLVTDLGAPDPRAERLAARFSGDGVTVRTIEMERFEDEIGALHALSLRAFANNVLYRPVDAETALALYAPLRPCIDPRFCLIAEDAGAIVGFVFAVPDVAQLRRTGTVDTVIVKTLARSPDRRYVGLGVLLADMIRERIHAAGYRRAIHALMHDANVSAAQSAKSARVVRRYALFGKEIAA